MIQTMPYSGCCNAWNHLNFGPIFILISISHYFLFVVQIGFSAYKIGSISGTDHCGLSLHGKLEIGLFYLTKKQFNCARERKGKRTV